MTNLTKAKLKIFHDWVFKYTHQKLNEDKTLRLNDLGLTSNYLAKLIPLIQKKFPKLKTLDLSNNKIERLPDSIVEFSDLEYLTLNNNGLKSLSESIGDLRKLKHLELINNKVEKLPDSIKKLSNLKTLLASSNNLKSIPEYLKKLANSIEIFENIISQAYKTGLFHQVDCNLLNHHLEYRKNTLPRLNNLKLNKYVSLSDLVHLSRTRSLTNISGLNPKLTDSNGKFKYSRYSDFMLAAEDISVTMSSEMSIEDFHTFFESLDSNQKRNVLNVYDDYDFSELGIKCESKNNEQTLGDSKQTLADNIQQAIEEINMQPNLNTLTLTPSNEVESTSYTKLQNRLRKRRKKGRKLFSNCDGDKTQNNKKIV